MMVLLHELVSKAKRGYNHLFTIILTLSHESEHRFEGVRVKYLFFPNESDTLLVSFPAFATHGARYNYVRTLSTYRTNKLFLLDDFSPNKRGCYLVENSVEKCTKQLISSIIDKCNRGG